MQTMAYEFLNVYEAFRFPSPNLAAFAIRPHFFCFQTPEIRFIFFVQLREERPEGDTVFVLTAIRIVDQDFGLEK